MLVKESRDSRVCNQPVGSLDQPVPFVGENKVFHGQSAFAHGSDDLFRFLQWYSRIIGAMDDNERRCDAINRVNRRNLLEELSIMFKCPILRFAQLAPPGTRILQERHEVSDPNNIHARRPQIRICSHRGEYPEATVLPPITAILFALAVPLSTSQLTAYCKSLTESMRSRTSSRLWYS